MYLLSSEEAVFYDWRNNVSQGLDIIHEYGVSFTSSNDLLQVVIEHGHNVSTKIILEGPGMATLEKPVLGI